jgi:ureidoacrylate peracid hydrolase
VLRNLGVRSLVLVGGLTDQCVDSAVRDACDLGYLVTCVTDACATLTQDRHDWALRNNSGYCRQRTTDQMLAEIARLVP